MLKQLIHDFRKRLGWLKWQITDVMWDNLQVPLAKRIRPKLFKLLDSLPKITTELYEKQIEVHMLCGHNNVDMGIWASWSLLRFMKSTRFFLHSDGTLTQDDLSLWRKVLPDLVFVDNIDATTRLAEIIAPKYPKINSWRPCDQVRAQAVDYHLFGDSEYILSLDSDVICFRSPNLIQEFVCKATVDLAYLRDSGYAYPAPIEELNSFSSVPLRPFINGGFMLTRRFGKEDWELINDILCRVTPEIGNHYWMTQALYAFWAAAKNQVELPGEYLIGKGKTSDSTIVRHYTSRPLGRRARFFTEAIPKLIKEL